MISFLNLLKIILILTTYLVNAQQNSLNITKMENSLTASSNLLIESSSSIISGSAIDVSVKAQASIQSGSVISSKQATIQRYQNLGNLHKIALRYDDYLAKQKPESLVSVRSTTTLHQYTYRELIFNDNINKINNHNQDKTRKFNQGINKFTDFTESQFNVLYNTLKVPNNLQNKGKKILTTKLNTNNLSPTISLSSTKPSSQVPLLGATIVIDSLSGIVIQSNAASQTSQASVVYTIPENITIDWSCLASPIINQGRCGSCYIAAPLQSIFITRKIYKKAILPLSIQQIISCATPATGGNGCNGGYFNSAFDYAKNSGVGRAIMYPYDAKAINQGINSPCNALILDNNQYKNSKTFIPSSAYIPSGDCASLVNQLKFGVVAVSINAQLGLQFYANGTYNPATGVPNHGVTLVGYDPINQYKIKNSWGNAWGNSGYAYVSANAGVCDYAMYPVTGFQSKQMASSCII